MSAGVNPSVVPRLSSGDIWGSPRFEPLGYQQNDPVSVRPPVGDVRLDPKGGLQRREP